MYNINSKVSLSCVCPLFRGVCYSGSILKCIFVLRLDTIDKWDEEKLKEVVNKKHATKTKTKTDIVSHFDILLNKCTFSLN